MLLMPQSTLYVDRACELLDDEEVLRWLSMDGPIVREDVHDFYRRWHVPSDNGDCYHFAILERDERQLVGSISLRFTGHPGTGDVGYWLGRAYWGRGFMTEAIGLICRLGFEELDASVLCAWVFVGNEGSRIALERNGFQYVRTSVGTVRKGDRVGDEWYFALVRSQWQRERREARPV